MANGFGSLFIGVSGLQSSQNALNITANNLSNVDTTGYVRQRVYYSDRNYVTLDTTTAISYQQTGLGVQIGDVIHSRDIFLDESYRSTNGRLSFYEATYAATSEVETYFQELEGETFQDAMEDFWTAVQELAKAPDDSVYQNLLVQSAEIFLNRASAVYQGLQEYQYNINTQIDDDIDRINELGETIYNLNVQIQKIEAGGVETAMTLRDERDLALDELSALANISYYENTDGVVKVTLEGTEFVSEATYHEIGKQVDRATGFISAYWPYLSDEDKNDYNYVFKLSGEISADRDNDKGELKALLLARGDHVADYTDVEGVDADTYNDTTGMSVMMEAEAELDQLIHKMVTAINDILCPNVAASNYITDWDSDGTTVLYGADGTEYQISQNTLLLDTDNCAVGSDQSLPPQELFTRVGCDRYTEVTDADGNTYYIYNEENVLDSSTMYTLKSLNINDALVEDSTLLPHLTQTQNNNQVAMDMAQELADLWEKEWLTLNANDTNSISFKTYYDNMISQLATDGNVYSAMVESLSDSALSLDNSRLQVTGVSSDEELTNMIKYQNAYNASSRFINVINEMIEYMITQMG